MHLNSTKPSRSSSFSAPTFPSPQDKRHAQFYSGIRNGLWEPKHEEKMGKAVFLFGWLVSRQTAQNGSTGSVFGGRLLTYEEISQRSGWPARKLRHWLDLLRQEGYIERIRKSRGFAIRILNAKKFGHAQAVLAFSDCQETVTHDCQETGTHEQKTVTHRGRNLLMKSKSEGKGGHPLFQVILDYAFEAYEERRGFKPSWTGEDFRALKELLGANPGLTLPEFQQVFQNYLASSKQFYREKGWRLKYCCTDFDGLRDGPIVEQGGGNHGAPTTRKTSGRGDADPRLARFRQVGRKASDFAQRAH